jgi:hypothetical protein
MTAMGFAAAAILGFSSAQADPRVSRETKGSPLTFRLASTTSVTGYERVTLPTDNSTLYVAPRALWTGNEVVSAQTREGSALELTLSPDAAKRLTNLPTGDRLAMYIDGTLTTVGRFTTTNDRVAISGLESSHLERVVKMLNGVRPVPVPVPSSTAAVINVVPVGTEDGLYVVDLFVQGVTGLRTYQVALTVSGGTAGALTRSDIHIDEERADYVFADQDVISAADQGGGRITSLLRDGAIDRTDPGYLGTFRFRPTSEAAGTFEIAVDMSARTFLSDGANEMIEFRAGPAATLTMNQAPPRRSEDR